MQPLIKFILRTLVPRLVAVIMAIQALAWFFDIDQETRTFFDHNRVLTGFAVFCWITYSVITWDRERHRLESEYNSKLHPSVKATKPQMGPGNAGKRLPKRGRSHRITKGAD